MSISISKLLELQGRLYEAEQDYGLLCKLFDEVRVLFNASAASVVLAPRDAPEEAIVWTKSYSRSDLAFYFERMADDVFLSTYMQHMLLGKAVIVDQLLNFDRIDNPVFREEMVPRFQARYALCILVPLSARDEFAITLHRELTQPPFTSADQQLLQLLSDGLGCWARSYRRRQRLNEERTLLTALLERDNRPRAAVDQYGHLQLANCAMQRALNEYRITLSHFDHQLVIPSRWQPLWRESLSRGTEGRLVLPLSESHRVILEWTPLPEPPGWFELMLIDPRWEHERHLRRMELLYGLTKSEQDVLTLLSRGLTGAEVARLRGVSIETGKSQVKTLLRKTNTNNQNDLLNLLFNISH
ncbi:hypothetical protein ACET7H_13000 [Aeromonas veronii]|uniref:hypothetical protein n=1 Tax=Aeromonas veronii TaxID=654 RepID=UPI0038D76B60